MRTLRGVLASIDNRSGGDNCLVGLLECGCDNFHQRRGKQMDEPRDQLVDVFFKLIKKHRESRGLSLEAVAEVAGIHRTHLGLLERGERQPSLSVAIYMARALGFELSDLMLKSELVASGKVSISDVFQSMMVRAKRPECIRNSDSLEKITGLTGEMLLEAIHGTYNMLDTIDAELVTNGLPPIGNLVELANLSSMVGNMIGGAIAEASQGLYVRNKPHHYPDLLPQRQGACNLELKMALEKNRPKGHLPKAGTYLTIRYVLGKRDGSYTTGKQHRADTVWIWEVKVGTVAEADFDISNTAGDSGKTAVVKTTVLNAMKLVYFDKKYCPYAAGRKDGYPGFN